jgi:hypothetical protein
LHWAHDEFELEPMNRLVANPLCGFKFGPMMDLQPVRAQAAEMRPDQVVKKSLILVNLSYA